MCSKGIVEGNIIISPEELTVLLNENKGKCYFFMPKIYLIINALIEEVDQHSIDFNDGEILLQGLGRIERTKNPDGYLNADWCYLLKDFDNNSFGYIYKGHNKIVGYSPTIFV